jgi:regulator of nucleoside diphosphate kinase
MTVSEVRSVLLRASDKKRLESVLEALLDREDPLLAEIDNATVVPDADLPSDIVTMNSEVEVSDFNTGETILLNLVYPRQLNGATGQVSVAAPVGAALIGLREGEQIEWPLPFNKVRRLQVISVRQH